jgi:hypothetical protein
MPPGRRGTLGSLEDEEGIVEGIANGSTMYSSPLRTGHIDGSTGGRYFARTLRGMCGKVIVTGQVLPGFVTIATTTTHEGEYSECTN